MKTEHFDIVTVTLNPATTIDQVPAAIAPFQAMAVSPSGVMTISALSSTILMTEATIEGSFMLCFLSPARLRISSQITTPTPIRPSSSRTLRGNAI